MKTDRKIYCFKEFCVNSVLQKYNLNSEVNSEHSQTSVNGFRLTCLLKSFILDVCLGPECAPGTEGLQDVHTKSVLTPY